MELGARIEQLLDGGRRCVEQVLTVVDDEQQVPRPQIADDDVLDGSAFTGPQAPGAGDRRHDEVGVGDRGQLHEPCPVRPLRGRPTGGLDRQPGLAGAAYTSERHEPVAGHERSQVVQLLTPPHE